MNAQKLPAASAWLGFERAVTEVKELFFDVDLAVRGKIHRGIRLQWLPRAPSGERRLRRYLRVLDKMVAEEVVIERGTDDTWVQRFVEGPNAGTRFVGHFEEEGPALTRVRLEAWVGPNGFAQGLGKLSPLGLEKAMKRVLGEYKLALQGYEPGHARGAVLTALASATRWIPAMRALDETRRRQAVSVLLEVAWSIASVDEAPDEAERDAMRAVVAALWHTTLEAAVEERMVRAAVDGVQKHGALHAARGEVGRDRLRRAGHRDRRAPRGSEPRPGRVGARRAPHAHRFGGPARGDAHGRDPPDRPGSIGRRTPLQDVHLRLTRGASGPKEEREEDREDQEDREGGV